MRYFARQPRLLGSSKVTLRSPTCSFQSLNRLTRAVGRSSISAAGGGSLLPASWGGRGSRVRLRGKRLEENSLEESEAISERERGCNGGFLKGILHH